MVSFGLTNQILTLYLKELGISEVNIGMFMSLTMIGDSIISYLLTWNANKIGNKFIMILGSFLMIIASLIFSTGTSNFGYLLFAAIVGVISPSGNDTGPFKTIEETVLAHLTPPNHRPEIYAIHNVLGSIGASLGSFGAGLLIDYFIKYLNFEIKDAYGYSFYVLVLTSSLKFISLLFISHKAESTYIPPYKLIGNDSYNSIEDNNNLEIETTQRTIDSTSSSTLSENRPLMRIESTIEHVTITGLSPKTQSILFKLLIPFVLDSFGYGFMTNAWVVYYFKKRYKVSAMILGTLFGFSGIAMSISAIPSAWFAKRFGPIKSSVLTQIPCGLFFISIPLLGYNFPIASIFYLLNQMTTAFDVVPRQIILTSLIEPIELPKVMGTVNIGKQIARSISPYFTGYFAQYNLLWICFVITGVLLIIANLILAFDFKHLDEKIRKLEQTNHDI
jgi:MFS family permease